MITIKKYKNKILKKQLELSNTISNKRIESSILNFHMFILIYVITLSVITIALIFPTKIAQAFFLISYICFHIISTNSKYNKYFPFFNLMLICLSTFSLIVLSLNYPLMMPSTSNSISYNVFFIIARFILMFFIVCIIMKEYRSISILNLFIILLIGMLVIYYNPVILYIFNILGISLPITINNSNNIYTHQYGPHQYGPHHYGPRVDLNGRGDTYVTDFNNLYEVTMYRANYFYHNQNTALKEIYHTLVRKLILSGTQTQFFTVDEISIAVMHGAEVKHSLNPPFVFPAHVTLISICEAAFMLPNVSPSPNFFQDVQAYGVQRVPFDTRLNGSENSHRPFIVSQDKDHKYVNAVWSPYMCEEYGYLKNSLGLANKNKIILNTPATWINKGQQLPTGPTWRAIVDRKLYPFANHNRAWEL